MIRKRNPISVESSVQRVMEHAKIGLKEIISIENAHGRFLAEDVIADEDVPSFDRSLYDGFAIRSEDSASASTDNPVSIKVVGKIGAGSLFNREIKTFEAVRIMTGAPIPRGCDSVVMFESAIEYTVNSDEFIKINKTYNKNDNIYFRGEEVQKGTVLVKKGAYINPGVSALLATFGYSKVTVSKKPIVGVFATGSELLEIGDSLKPGKIRNSNSYMILSQIEKSGGEVKYFGSLTDDMDTCFTAIKKALTEVDLLITTGGVSVGDYDYLPVIYEKLGASVLFNKVAMRPGSVTTVAKINGKFLFGLSGNPAASYIGFELFVRPVIRKYLFNNQPHLKKVSAFLGEDLSKSDQFTHFIRGKLCFHQGKLFAFSSGPNKSSNVSSIADSNILIILPYDVKGYQKGMIVDILLIDDK